MSFFDYFQNQEDAAQAAQPAGDVVTLQIGVAEVRVPLAEATTKSVIELFRAKASALGSSSGRFTSFRKNGVLVDGSAPITEVATYTAVPDTDSKG